MTSDRKYCGLRVNMTLTPALMKPHPHLCFLSPLRERIRGEGASSSEREKGRGGFFNADCGLGKAHRANTAIGILLTIAITSTSYALDSAPVVTAPVVMAPVAAPADTVASIETHYRDLVDLTAKVVQKNFLKSVDKTQKFDGSLSIKKPGKLRLEYTNGQVIVIDGKEAWFYSKKSAQAIRRTFKDFEQANIPVAFLLGAAHIRDDFDIVELKGPAIRNTVDLTPRKKDAAMKKLGLVCDDGGRITGMVIYDKSGNTSSIAFSDAKENIGLDDALFLFKVPKGTEVIEQ
jgi:outer membrane lipoprotein carrier protein